MPPHSLPCVLWSRKQQSLSFPLWVSVSKIMASACPHSTSWLGLTVQLVFYTSQGPLMSVASGGPSQHLLPPQLRIRCSRVQTRWKVSDNPPSTAMKRCVYADLWGRVGCEDANSTWRKQHQVLRGQIMVLGWTVSQQNPMLNLRMWPYSKISL